MPHVNQVQMLLDAKTNIETALPDATPQERLQFIGLLLLGPQRPDTEPASPRTGTKAEQLLGMLRRPRGATLDEVIKTFDIKKNSAYARISVVTRAAGVTVEHVDGRYKVEA